MKRSLFHLYLKKKQMIFFSSKKSFQAKTEIQNKINTPHHSEKNPFEEKREWERGALWQRINSSPTRTRNNYGFSTSSYKRKEVLEKIFPKGKFGNYISKEDFKKRLRDLKIEEQKAKSYNDKKWFKNLRTYLEREVGLKDKY